MLRISQGKGTSQGSSGKGGRDRNRGNPGGGMGALGEALAAAMKNKK